MTNKEKYEASKARVFRAIRKEKQDRVPIAFMTPTVPCVKYADPTKTVADVYDNPEESTDICLDVIKKHFPEVDIVGMLGGPATVSILGSAWISQTRLPGRDLPRDVSAQVFECESIKDGDYERILTSGWSGLKEEIIFQRLGYSAEEFGCLMQIGDRCAQKGIDAGYYEYDTVPPFLTYDLICSGRGLVKFHRDLRKNPDMMKEVLDIVLEDELKAFKGMIKGRAGEIAAITPANRANCDVVSRDHFEKFAWPHFKAFADAALEEGLDIYFHMDSNWTDFLDIFTCFPKNRCIFDTDGATDIYKVKEVLGDRMAITGNISASLLAVGNPDDVYKQCRQEIEAFGPEGFILSSSCSLPLNTKPECLDAFYASVMG
ncbi:MAG: hypothetical protein HGA54_08960 [Actinobacteria bacterium]|nr:hypothetical protein [Actinomycetota bacterium]